MNQKLTQLNEMIKEAKIISFFGGAGVSTESGLPDYRSKDGRYTKMNENNVDPRKVLNRRYIKNNPIDFFNRYRRDNQFQPKPNAAHRFLADLEKRGKDVRVLTQNVDSLHHKAGHRFVLELHGHQRTWFCMTCERVYLPNELEQDENNVPRCHIDNGIIRPNVIYFGESPKNHIMDKAKEVLSESDLLIIAGTSLRVPPRQKSH